MATAVRFLLDQHIAGALANGLRMHGIDVLTIHEAGRCSLPDPDQLDFATAQGRVMVTHDVDYLTLAASGIPHSGIAWCAHGSRTTRQMIKALLLIHGVLDADEMRDRVEYL